MNCQYCNKTLKNRKSLKVHEKTCGLPTIRRFHCDTCQKSFTNKAHLTRHKADVCGKIKKKPDKEYFAQCPMIKCGKKLKTLNSYIKHLNFCAMSRTMAIRKLQWSIFSRPFVFFDSDLEFKCPNDHCRASFDNEKSLIVHKERCDIYGGAHHCDKCKQTFRYKYLLKEHYCPDDPNKVQCPNQWCKRWIRQDKRSYHDNVCVKKSQCNECHQFLMFDTKPHIHGYLGNLTVTVDKRLVEINIREILKDLTPDLSDPEDVIWKRQDMIDYFFELESALLHAYSVRYKRLWKRYYPIFYLRFV